MSPDFLDLLRALSDAEARFLVVGAWPGRIQADFGEGVRCNVIGLNELLRNKRASARPHDLADVDALERLIKAKMK